MNRLKISAVAIAVLLSSVNSAFAQIPVDDRLQKDDEDTALQASPPASSVYDDDDEPSSTQAFSGYDLTWQNGNDRRDHSVLQTKYFTGSFMLDANYTYSFNNPVDNTVIGSTAIARINELQVSFVGFGGDFNYKNVRGRLMTQFGNRSIVVPRNDYSPYRGQYQLANAYRYISEALQAITSISVTALMWMPACSCRISV